MGYPIVRQSHMKMFVLLEGSPDGKEGFFHRAFLGHVAAGHGFHGPSINQQFIHMKNQVVPQTIAKLVYDWVNSSIVYGRYG